MDLLAARHFSGHAGPCTLWRRQPARSGDQDEHHRRDSRPRCRAPERHGAPRRRPCRCPTCSQPTSPTSCSGTCRSSSIPTASCSRPFEDAVACPWFEPYFRYFTGGVEAVASLLLFIPGLQVAGAAVAFATMAGAISFHLCTRAGHRSRIMMAEHCSRRPAPTWCSALPSWRSAGTRSCRCCDGWSPTRAWRRSSTTSPERIAIGGDR